MAWKSLLFGMKWLQGQSSAVAAECFRVGDNCSRGIDTVRVDRVLNRAIDEARQGSYPSTLLKI